MSLAIRNTRNVTMCLAALARLAFAEGDPEQAALLAGAAEGLRGRAGLRAWPVLRRAEAELAAQVRPGAGADRFGQAYAAGPGLSQRKRLPPSGTGPVTAPSRPEPWPADPIGSNHRGEKDCLGLNQKGAGRR